MAQPEPLSLIEIRKHVVRDSDERLRNELKRVFPDLDAGVVNGMSRDELIEKITELRAHEGIHTSLKGPITGVVFAPVHPVTPVKPTVVKAHAPPPVSLPTQTRVPTPVKVSPPKPTAPIVTQHVTVAPPVAPVQTTDPMQMMMLMMQTMQMQAAAAAEAAAKERKAEKEQAIEDRKAAAAAEERRFQAAAEERKALAAAEERRFQLAAKERKAEKEAEERKVQAVTAERELFVAEMARKQEEYKTQLNLVAQLHAEDVAARRREAERLEARHTESMTHAQTQRDAGVTRENKKEKRMKGANELLRGCLYPMSDNAMELPMFF